jgi:hypothetical protein
MLFKIPSYLYIQLKPEMLIRGHQNCSSLQWIPWQRKQENYGIAQTPLLAPSDLINQLTLSGNINKMWISFFTLISYKHQRANLYIEDIGDMHSLAHSTVAMSRWKPCIFSNVQTSMLYFHFQMQQNKKTPVSWDLGIHHGENREGT